MVHTQFPFLSTTSLDRSTNVGFICTRLYIQITVKFHFLTLKTILSKKCLLLQDKLSNCHIYGTVKLRHNTKKIKYTDVQLTLSMVLTSALKLINNSTTGN